MRRLKSRRECQLIHRRRRPASGDWAVLVFITVFLLPVGASASEEELDGLTIVAIRFERFDVFDTSDPDTSSRPYRWANSLHVVSRESFIRSRLLFEEGDPYSAQLAAESARLLRDRRLMNPVEIFARRVSGGVEVTVETHDHWSLRSGGKVGIFGNRTNFSLDFEDDNLLGSGKGVSLSFHSDHERNALAYRYHDPNVLNSRWRLNIERARLSDGLRDEVWVDRPFYSLSTPWSWGARTVREELVEHLYSKSVEVARGNRRGEYLRVWSGLRLPGGGETTHRLEVGWVHSRERFTGWSRDDGSDYAPPEDRVIAGPSIAFELITGRYAVLEGFRAWSVQEDVALGPNLRIGATFSLPAFGGDERRLLLDGKVGGGALVGNWLLVGTGWMSGRVERGGARDVVVGVQMGAAQLGPRGWRMRLFAETSHELDSNRQLALGADTGLRGWDPDYFDGASRAVLNVQWRTLLKKDFLGLLSVGVLVFGDAGATWAPRVGVGSEGLRFDAGVGLLFDLSHLSRTSLVQVNVAVPDDGSGLTVIVSTSAIF